MGKILYFKNPETPKSAVSETHEKQMEDPHREMVDRMTDKITNKVMDALAPILHELPDEWCKKQAERLLMEAALASGVREP